MKLGYELSELLKPAREERFITLIATGADPDRTLSAIHAVTSVERMISTVREDEK